MLEVRMPERRRHHRERGSGGGRIAVRHRALPGAWQDGETLDIGSGGAFLIGATWPIGTAVELAVAVAARPEPLVLGGVVRWMVGDGSADAGEHAGEHAGLGGVGVQFLDLELDVVIELNRHLAELTEAASRADAGAGHDDDDIPATD